MCRIVNMQVDERTIRVADIKQNYILNIVKAAKNCDYIKRVVLFGSSLEERCTTNSDIDLAVFGNVPRTKCLTSKKYEQFLQTVFSFNDYDQSYDILYFQEGKAGRHAILRDIASGEVLYEAK